MLVGSSTSAVSVLLGLIVVDKTGWVDLEAIAKNATIYIVTHPARGLGFFVCVLLASYLAAWGLARWLYRRSRVLFGSIPRGMNSYGMTPPTQLVKCPM